MQRVRQTTGQTAVLLHAVTAGQHRTPNGFFGPAPWFLEVKGDAIVGNPILDGVAPLKLGSDGSVQEAGTFVPGQRPSPSTTPWAIFGLTALGGLIIGAGVMAMIARRRSPAAAPPSSSASAASLPLAE